MKGRKPQSENVVPMRDEDLEGGHNLDERARAKLSEIESCLAAFEISRELLEVFRRLALPLCHPTRDRLHPGNAFMFLQLARAVQRHEKLLVAIEETETYVTETRNGKQLKSLPEVGQVNETFRQIRGLANEFGMTPASERSLTGGGQLPFDFGKGEADYFT